MSSKFLDAAKLWAAAAWADGVMAEEERAGMALIIKLADLDEAEHETAMSWLETPVDASELNVAGLDDAQKASMYQAAARITAIDRNVVDAERLFLERLRDSLGLDEATAAALRAEVGIE